MKQLVKHFGILILGGTLLAGCSSHKNSDLVENQQEPNSASVVRADPSVERDINSERQTESPTYLGAASGGRSL